MTRLLHYLVLVACLYAPLTAEAQRVYTKPGDGGIEDSSSPDYIPLSERVNEAECQALRATSNTGKGYMADVVRTDLMNTGGMICPCAPKPGLWLERLVYCFADAPDGLIYNIMQDLIARASIYYWQFYLPLIMFSMALFGWKMATGQLRQVTKDTFLFVVKLGAIITFLAFFPTIHGQVLRMVQALAQLPSDALNGFSDICNFGGTKIPNIWAQWDCIFGKLIGLSTADPSSGVIGSGLFMGILGYLISFLPIPGFGVIICMAGISAISMLISSALRAINTYFMSILAVSFMLLIGPIFVPLLLFGASIERFKTWLRLLIGYMLQPMMLIMFLSVMMVTMQYAIFQGPTSLFGTIANVVPTSSAYFMQLFADTGNGTDVTKNFKKDTILKSNVSANPEKALSKPGQSNSLEYGSKKGDIGVMPDAPVAPAGMDSGKDNIQGGVQVDSVDPQLATDLNNRPGAVKKNMSFLGYMEEVALQLLSTVLLAYTLFTILGNIPDIAHALVGSGSANLAKAKMVGQAQAERGMAIAKQMLKAALDAKTGGMASTLTGGDKGVMGVISKAFGNMAGKRS